MEIAPIPASGANNDTSQVAYADNLDIESPMATNTSHVGGGCVEYAAIQNKAGTSVDGTYDTVAINVDEFGGFNGGADHSGDDIDL